MITKASRLVSTGDLLNFLRLIGVIDEGTWLIGQTEKYMMVQRLYGTGI